MINNLRKTASSVGVITLVSLFLISCSDQNENMASDDQAKQPEASQVVEKDNSAEAIHERVMTLDSHIDVDEDMTFDPKYDPGTLTEQQVDLVKMEQGGLDSGFFSVYMGQTARTPEGYAEAKARALRKFDAIHRMTEMYPDRIGFAYTPKEFREIAASGRKVASIGIENGYAIGKDLSLLEDYYNRGARYMTLAHNGHNDICDSAQPQERLGDGPEEHGGVSEFGYKVIDEMNRLGMMVDISHVSVKCMMQATAYSKAPPIASHSSVYALAAHVRNMTDEQMIALKEAGGVMQIVAFGPYVKYDPERDALRMELLQKVMATYDDEKPDYGKYMSSDAFIEGMKEIDRTHPEPTVKDFVDHIDYAVNLIGVDHVGIVADFEGGGGVKGWNNAAETFNVTKELVDRGYSEEDIAKIWGGNILAVWEKANEVAIELNKQ